MTPSYYIPKGGLPPQNETIRDKSFFTPSYLMIDRRALSDITTSFLPQWTNTRLWVLARPMTGFSETFSHYVVEISAGGGSNNPEPDSSAEAVIFVVGGTAEITLDGEITPLVAGSYVFISPNSVWQMRHTGDEPCVFHWIRKRYCPASGVSAPPSFITSDSDTPPIPMPETDGKWATSRFADPQDMRHDMHVNIVTFEAGGKIPFAETHVMEHGIYVLEGTAAYYVNQDWIEVEAGDYLWLRAFSPQACFVKGDARFRYILYKDVNRHMPLIPVGFGSPCWFKRTI